MTTPSRDRARDAKADGSTAPRFDDFGSAPRGGLEASPKVLLRRCLSGASGARADRMMTDVTVTAATADGGMTRYTPGP